MPNCLEGSRTRTYLQQNVTCPESKHINENIVHKLGPTLVELNSTLKNLEFKNLESKRRRRIILRKPFLLF
jgi:hypothetical protein